MFVKVFYSSSSSWDTASWIRATGLVFVILKVLQLWQSSGLEKNRRSCLDERWNILKTTKTNPSVATIKLARPQANANFIRISLLRRQGQVAVFQICNVCISIKKVEIVFLKGPQFCSEDQHKHKNTKGKKKNYKHDGKNSTSYYWGT